MGVPPMIRTTGGTPVPRRSESPASRLLQRALRLAVMAGLLIYPGALVAFGAAGGG